MSDIQELVEKVIVAKRGDVIWPPADTASVEAVRRYIHGTFGIELPSSYVALVSRTDGLEYNSYVIFGTISHRDPYLPSVQELNQILFNEPKPHAFSARLPTNCSLIVQKMASGVLLTGHPYRL